MASALIQCVIRTQTGWIKSGGRSDAVAPMLVMAIGESGGESSGLQDAGPMIGGGYFFISSFDMLSFLSIMPSDFFILSDVLDVASVFLSILSILSILSLAIAGLPIVSSAKAAGANTRPVAIIAANNVFIVTLLGNDSALSCYQET